VFSEAILVYKTVPVLYSDRSEDFKLAFRVAIWLVLLKTNKNWATLFFVGEPILCENPGKLDQENVFHAYVSIRDKIKTAAVAEVKKELELRDVLLMIPQYN